MSLVPMNPVDREFRVGDLVEVLCRDGATFHGWITDLAEQFIVLTGPKAFPYVEIAAMVHA